MVDPVEENSFMDTNCTDRKFSILSNTFHQLEIYAKLLYIYIYMSEFHIDI